MSLRLNQQERRTFQQTLQLGEILGRNRTVHHPVVRTDAQSHPLAHDNRVPGPDHRFLHHRPDAYDHCLRRIDNGVEKFNAEGP